MKKLGIVMLVAVLAAVAWTVPAFAKSALNEQELDAITAAGEPEVLLALGAATFGTSSSTIVGGTLSLLINSRTLVLALATSSQRDLRALTLNNILGENNVANAMNIQSTSGTIGGTQTITITANWASTVDVAVLPGSAGGSTPGCVAFCTAGAGGPATRLSIQADEILIGGFIVKIATSTEAFALAQDSQTSLAALIVNNVVGNNVVANGTNIASGTLNIQGGTGAQLAVNGAAAAAAITQTVNITMNRGSIPSTR